MSDDKQPHKAIYWPQRFETETLEQAMAIAVTPEVGTTTAERWAKETPFLVDEIGQLLSVGPDSCLLDYGCGPGRVAKGLIDRFGCRVIGIDTSRNMRLLAPEYVLSERFTVWSPEVLDKMIDKGFRVDACVCLWVLQHAHDPADVIQRISRALSTGGALYALNQTVRCIPTDRGWSNDGFDVRAALRRAFQEVNYHSLPSSASSEGLAAISMIQLLRKRPT